jgi:hypothetical protein
LEIKKTLASQGLPLQKRSWASAKTCIVEQASGVFRGLPGDTGRTSPNHWQERVPRKCRRKQARSRERRALALQNRWQAELDEAHEKLAASKPTLSGAAKAHYRQELAFDDRERHGSGRQAVADLTVASFPAPKDVRVLSTSKGTVVMVDYGFGGVTVIGDSIGVYWGEEAPPYFT